MATLVQSKVGGIGAIFAGDGVNNEAPVSLDAAPAVNNHIIVLVWCSEIRSVSSIADDASSSYTAPRAKHSGAAGSVQQWITKANSTSAGQGVIVTLSGAQGDDALIVVLEVSGLADDQSAASTNGAAVDAATAHNSGSVTASNAGICVAMQSRTNGTWTDDSGFTEISTGSESYYVGYIAAPTGSQELNQTSEDNEFSVTQIVAFVGAAAVTGQPTVKRFGGVPHMAGRKRFGSGSGGGAWGRRNGIIVPAWVKEVA